MSALIFIAAIDAANAVGVFYLVWRGMRRVGP
jgi:hypothetical protein